MELWDDNVKAVIRKAKESAPGPDGVRYSHMKTFE